MLSLHVLFLGALATFATAQQITLTPTTIRGGACPITLTSTIKQTQTQTQTQTVTSVSTTTRTSVSTVTSTSTVRQTITSVATVTRACVSCPTLTATATAHLVLLTPLRSLPAKAQFWLPPVTTFEGTLDNHPAQVGHSFALSERLLEIC
ncbi:hypothetical protein MCOR03_004365 [Pyricularia oryzae]|nr:hypothetical protein MCOR03_004365 [Pyricularia oryzae]